MPPCLSMNTAPLNWPERCTSSSSLTRFAIRSVTADGKPYRYWEDVSLPSLTRNV
jgi:hypothetical protein